MGPLVTVDVTPTTSAPRELAALLESCSRALPSGGCRSAQELDTVEQTAAATVIWLDEWHAHIEVRLEHQTSGTLTRDLTFSRDDARLERFRSVGLAIATIVDQSEDERDESPETRDAATPTPDSATNEATQAAPAPTIRPPRAPATQLPDAVPRARRPSAAGGPARAPLDAVEAGGALGTGLASGPARVGLYVRATHDVNALPVFVGASVAYAVLASGAEPSVTWSDLTLGGGARLETPEFRFEVGLGARVSRTSATAADPGTRASDTRGVWLPGASLEARAAWPSRGPVALTLGAEGSWSSRRLRVTNAGREVGEVPAAHAGISAGGRVVW
jgi:hypothetical protein